MILKKATMQMYKSFERFVVFQEHSTLRRFCCPKYQNKTDGEYETDGEYGFVYASYRHESNSAARLEAVIIL